MQNSNNGHGRVKKTIFQGFKIVSVQGKKGDQAGLESQRRLEESQGGLTSQRRLESQGCIDYQGHQDLIEDKLLVIEDAKIKFLDADQFSKLQTEAVEDLEIVTGSGYLMPGFIDLHIHGAAGFDTMDASPEALAEISKALCQSGVTAFLPTTMTMAWNKIEAALENVRSYAGSTGAKILGVHMEGPFISKRFKGAQPEEHIIAPDFEKIRPFSDIVRLISMAPEEDLDFKFIKATMEYNENLAKKEKIIISLGHSNADYKCAKEAFELGASHITHCFNAMTSLHHRRPGLVGAALIHPFKTEFITDGIHIVPEIFNVIMANKRVEDIILVTDAMRASFLPDGEYELGGNPVKVQNGLCTLKDGTIAGSVHRLDNALKNMLKYSKFSLGEIVLMLSLNPAEELGISESKGSLEDGKDADIVVMDKDFNVKATYVEGVKQF